MSMPMSMGRGDELCSKVHNSINGVVVTWVVAIRVEKLDPPGVRFPLNASPSAALLFLGGFSFLGSFRVVQYHSPFGV